MNTDQLTEKSFYKRSGIGVAVFFGSSLAGAFLMAHNLKKLGRHDEIKRTYIYCIGIMVTVISLSYLVEMFVKLPSNSITTVVQLLATLALFDQIFKKDLKDLEQKVYISNWVAFGISLIFLVVLIGIVFGLSYVNI